MILIKKVFQVIVISSISFVTTTCSMLSFSSVSLPNAALQKEALAAHNYWRARHHAENLHWDNQLAYYAARHANRCRFQHSHGPYGENLAAGYSNMTTSVNNWYAEQKYYSYYRPGFSSRTGHFTQVVWKSSKRLGCAVKNCQGENGTPGQFWVCEYSPAGNIVNRGYFQRNVLPNT